MHDHHHEAEQSRLVIAVTINAAVTILQVVAGVVASSVGLLADATHNLMDTAAIVLALIALRLARREPGPAWTYGGVRWPVLAAQANSIVTLLLTLALVTESVERLAQPHHEVRGSVVLVVALIAALGNAVAMRVVADDHADLNTRAVTLHLLGDVLGSLAVAGAGLVILLAPSAVWVDPVASLLVACLIGWQAISLLQQSSRVLLEAVPAGLDLATLRARVISLDGVRGLHDVHVWSLSDKELAASAHLELHGHPTLQETRLITDRVKELLREEFAIGHATLEAE